MIKRGEVPEGYRKGIEGLYLDEWKSKPIKFWLKICERPIELEDNTEYELVTVRRNYGGVDSRGIFKGKDILVKNYFEVHSGDFLISKRQIAHGACGIVPPQLDHAVVSNEYNVFEPNEETNLEMFSMMMQLPNYKRLFYLMSDGVHIEKLLFKTNHWLKRKLAMPTYKEQVKIGTILKQYDNYIKLQTNLILEEKKQKQWLAQNLIGQKIRISGCDKKWKNVRLKNILQERKTYMQKGSKYPHVTLSTEGIYQKCERYDRDHLVKNEEKEYKVTHLNDICYNPANLKFGVISRNKFGSAIFSPIYVTFEVKEGYDIDFISQYLIRWDFINAVRKYEEGTVYERMSVSPKDFLKFKIALPEIEEQKAIAKILSQADEKIGLLEKRLEQTKLEKKAMMQLLLTGIVRVNQKGGE